MSSHPAACLASVKAFGSKSPPKFYVIGSYLEAIGTIDKALPYIRTQAYVLMKASPIDYVKDAKLRGSLFNPEDTNGLVSCVDSGFFVDHTEPLEALEWVRREMVWPLGELLDGHEFLLIVEARHRRPSSSVSR